MGYTDELFFRNNLNSVNKMVGVVLLACVIVPLSFLILTLAHIWVVPHYYSLSMIVYTLSVALIDFALNRNGKHSVFTMYFGLIAASVFVFLLGARAVIVVTVSYGLVPFLSCLYYNKLLTRWITFTNYLIILATTYIRAFYPHGYDAFYGYTQSNIEWFISHIIGLTIEFLFVLLISTYISRKSHNTLTELINSQEDRQNAYDKLLEQNVQNLELSNNLLKKNEELVDTQFKTIQFVSQVLGSHDFFTGRHVTHTKKYVELICLQLKKMGLYREELTDENIRLFSSAAFLHDIGKVHIPEAVLNKIGKFTAEEFELMKCHPTEGKKLLEYLPPIEGGKFNKIAVDMAYYHHEKWDGSGYPNKIAGTHIPLCARIMAGADVLDALISQRLYKDPMNIDQAMNVFENSKGSHFDPCIAEAVIQLRTIIEDEDKKFKEQENSSNAAELEWWQRYHSNFKNA